jgi:inositol 1,4,5-triphosphate receptor type 1/inositol 1,4,5-triphosphate receptor type 3
MCRAFRMLQLLCENNNVDMKNFIRVQTDSEGNTKLNSINLLEFVTSQLRIFLKIMNLSITVIPNFMMDFLIEVI